MSLMDLSSDYLISSLQHEQYLKDGHILLRGVASPQEAAAYRPLIGEAVSQFKKESRPLEQRDTYGKAFLQVGDLWEKNEGAKRFVMARRFAKIAADLMGVPAVRLFHDQALYKEGGGGNTPWHEDEHYWPMDTKDTITMWMPLIDVSAEMGTLRFATGSQNKEGLLDLAISDESEEIFKKVIAENQLLISPSVAMAAGDASFHCGGVLHSASGNQSAQVREVMTIIYFADKARVRPTLNPDQTNDLNHYFPGLKAGELAASPMTPVLYSRD